MVYKALNSPLLRQYVVVITVNLIVLSVGVGLAWTSPMLVKLGDPEETILPQPITDDEGSWVVAVGFLVGSLMNFMPTLLLGRLGFRYSILVGGFPKVVGAFLMLFATEVWMLILGRALSGMSDIFIFTVVPTYASDIASKEVRGALSTILQIMSSLGILIMLSVGPFVSYMAANILHVSIVVAALVPVLFLPESPYHLYMKGRSDESLKVLTFLRGSEAAASEELREYAKADTGEKVKVLNLFRDKVFWKSMGMVAVLVIGAQLIGFNAVSFYLQTILESTQTSVRPEIASVIIGLIQLTAGVFTTVITDRFGRKPIFGSTLIGMMIGMVGLGTFFFVTESADEIFGFMNYLPLISLILVIFTFSAGAGSLNWAVSAELFSNEGRPTGLSISMLMSGLSTFFMTLYFPLLMSSIGPAVTYWGFSVNCLLLCTFIIVIVPETKGKSFTEIQQALGAKIATDVEKANK